jgi:LacI family transcriptional regulator
MRIAEESRGRVLRAAAELNYRPNLLPRHLRTGVTRTIALISDTVATDQYAGQLVSGSLAAAVQHGRLLFLAETHGDRHLEERLINEFLDRQVDGFVYATMYTQQTEVPRALRGQPLALLNCTASNPKIAAVVPDEINAGRLAARTLLDAGHQDNIFIVGERAPTVVAGRERIQGIEAVLNAAGTRPEGTMDCNWWPQAAYEAVSQCLSTGARPKALICLNDRIALGAYPALHDAGLGIPDDVSVISFDDSELASWMRPALTSIAIPHHTMGQRAVERLLTESHPTGIERIPMPLRQRSSVAAPRNRP